MIQEFIDRGNRIHETKYQEFIYELLVDKYKPTNFFNVKPIERNIEEQDGKDQPLVSFQTTVLNEKRKRILEFMMRSTND